MKKYLPSIALLALLGTVCLAPATTYAQTPDQHIAGQKGDLLKDNRDLREQRRDIGNDNSQMGDAAKQEAQDLKSGNKEAARKEKEHIDDLRSHRIKHEHEHDAAKRTSVAHDHLLHSDERKADDKK